MVRTKGKEVHIWSQKSPESERRAWWQWRRPSNSSEHLVQTKTRCWAHCGRTAQTKMAPNQDCSLKPVSGHQACEVTTGTTGSQDITCGSQNEITARQGLQSKADVGYPGGIQLTRQASLLSDHLGVLPRPLPSLQAASGQADHSLLQILLPAEWRPRMPATCRGKLKYITNIFSHEKLTQSWTVSGIKYKTLKHTWLQ